MATGQPDEFEASIHAAAQNILASPLYQATGMTSATVLCVGHVRGDPNMPIAFALKEPQFVIAPDQPLDTLAYKELVDRYPLFRELQVVLKPEGITRVVDADQYMSLLNRLRSTRQ